MLCLNNIFLAILLIAVSCQKKDREIIYPESKKIEFSENIHGYVVEDFIDGLKILQ